MKNTIIITILILSFISCKAQQVVNINTFTSGNNAGKYYKDIDNVFDNFLGTWEYQNNNTIFRVHFTKLTKKEFGNGNSPSYYSDMIIGHYIKVEVLPNGDENIIYTSDKPVLNDAERNHWPEDVIIFSDTSIGIGLSGSIMDNVEDDNLQWGTLTCEIIQGSNPSQMTWKVDGYNLGGRNFRIPTDIIMTKIN